VVSSFFTRAQWQHLALGTLERGGAEGRRWCGRWRCLDLGGPSRHLGDWPRSR